MNEIKEMEKEELTKKFDWVEWEPGKAMWIVKGDPYWFDLKCACGSHGFWVLSQGEKNTGELVLSCKNCERAYKARDLIKGLPD